MLKLDTDRIMVGLLQISSGRTQREKMAFCLGDSANLPVLSLGLKETVSFIQFIQLCLGKQNGKDKRSVCKHISCLYKSYIFSLTHTLVMFYVLQRK